MLTCPFPPLPPARSLTDIYPEWLAAFPKVKAFVQTMKQ